MCVTGAGPFSVMLNVHCPLFHVIVLEAWAGCSSLLSYPARPTYTLFKFATEIFGEVESFEIEHIEFCRFVPVRFT